MKIQQNGCHFEKHACHVSTISLWLAVSSDFYIYLKKASNGPSREIAYISKWPKSAPQGSTHENKILPFDAGAKETCNLDELDSHTYLCRISCLDHISGTIGRDISHEYDLRPPNYAYIWGGGWVHPTQPFSLMKIVRSLPMENSNLTGLFTPDTCI